ncbi:MAG TPA: HD-GYP domain-containing protein, partial [Tissierellaceae bacterium]|nr:HD-GYP domain-containing protein [Tissierellaceae bacterium]
AIISAIMGHVYVISGGVVEEFHLMQTILILFIGIIVNSVVISTLISITEGKKFTEVCFSSLKGIMLNAGSVGILGIIMALAHLSYGFGAVVLFFGPLLLARHSFKLYIDMRNVYISTIETLGKIIEAKDPYTSGHANRVKKYSIMLAEAYGLDYDRIQNIKRAAVLHDIGKIAINDNILHKSTKLTQSEFAHIMKHPTVGADIISEMDFLKDVADIIRYHHERYDGTGYPEGIGGDEVPLEAYILAIADAYDAMTTDRPYRKALERKEALKEIGKNAGSQFHPSLAEKFISIMAN